MALKKARPRKSHCGRCAKELGGVASDIPSKIGKLSKTQKIPERPYAGVLCSNCLEDLLRYKVRFEAQASHPAELADAEFQRDLTIEKFLPKGWHSGLAVKTKK